MATALDGWRDYVACHDLAALKRILHPDVLIESPVLHTPQRGREITLKYLAGATAVLGGPNFRFLGEWRSETGAVLEFETEIDGVRVNGVDIITLTEDAQQIRSFKVMIRPLKAINLVHQLMGQQLARASSPGA